MPKKSAATALVEPDHRSALIAEAAYFRAESRDFAPGHEVDDWLAAELEVEALLAATPPAADAERERPKRKQAKKRAEQRKQAAKSAAKPTQAGKSAATKKSDRKRKQKRKQDEQ